MGRTSKNYMDDEGDTLVIGGKLVVEEGAEVEGLQDATNAYVLPTATDESLGGVKVGGGLAISDGVLSVVKAAVQAEIDTSGTVDAADVATAFNSLIGKLQAAGLMAAEG